MSDIETIREQIKQWHEFSNVTARDEYTGHAFSVITEALTRLEQKEQPQSGALEIFDKRTIRHEHRYASHKYGEGHLLTLDLKSSEYETIRAALSRVEGLPDGFALVPIEPTEGMLNAMSAEQDGGYDCPKPVYKAMLSAAPKVESGEKKSELKYLKEHHHASQTAIGLARVRLRNGDDDGALMALDNAVVVIDEALRERNSFPPQPPKQEGE